MGLALAVVVVGLGLVLGLVGTVSDGADSAVELVANGVAVLGLLERERTLLHVLPELGAVAGLRAVKLR